MSVSVQGHTTSNNNNKFFFHTCYGGYSVTVTTMRSFERSFKSRIIEYHDSVEPPCSKRVCWFLAEKIKWIRIIILYSQTYCIFYNALVSAYSKQQTYRLHHINLFNHCFINQNLWGCAIRFIQAIQSEIIAYRPHCLGSHNNLVH